MLFVRKLQSFTRVILRRETLDRLCVFLVLCCLIYQLPASAIAAIAESFGIYENVMFYSYRVKFAAVVLAVAGLNLLVNHRYIFRNGFFRLYIFFLFYITAIVWLNREMYASETSRADVEISALEFHLPIIFLYCVFFLIGFFLPRFYKYRLLLITILIALLCIIAIHVDFEAMGIDKKNYVDAKFHGNYLFIGDATSIAALISIAFIRTIKFRIIFAIVSTAIIFFIGSRTSFLVFSATVFLYFIISFKPKLLFASTIFIAAAGVALSSIDFAELEERNPRMFGVLVDLESDSSVQGRKELAIYGWSDISENVIMGKFGGQLSMGLRGEQKYWRGYIHNVLSYWRQFGVLALIIAAGFAFKCYSTLWKHRTKRNQGIFALYFLVSVFLLIETLFSRSYTFSYSHIFFGLTVAMSHTINSDKRSVSLAAQYYRPQERTKLQSPAPSSRRKRRRSRKKN